MTQQQLDYDTLMRSAWEGELDSAWADLGAHPEQWWDCREWKQSAARPQHPDFKRQDGSMLGLHGAPAAYKSILDGMLT